MWSNSAGFSAEPFPGAERFLRRHRKNRPTNRAAAAGTPTPRPTPRAVVFVDFDVVAGAAVVVADGVVAEELPVAAVDPDAVLDALADAPLDVVVVEEEVFVEVVETWVCVKASPMMVRVYTSDGRALKEKTSNGEAHSQSS